MVWKEISIKKVKMGLRCYHNTFLFRFGASLAKYFLFQEIYQSRLEASPANFFLFQEIFPIKALLDPYI